MRAALLAIFLLSQALLLQAAIIVAYSYTSTPTAISALAYNQTFYASNTTASVGDRIKIRVSVPSGQPAHGIYISTANITVGLPAGKTTSIVFTASSAGTYEFGCSAACGGGPYSANAKITVS